MNELGKLIKEKREELGISQRELAKKMGVANTLISKIELGKIKTPNFLITLKLSNLLNINLIDLLEVTDYDMLDANLIHDLEMYEIIAPTITSKYEKNNKIDIEKVIEDYKQNEINEVQAFALFANALELTSGEAQNLSAGILIAHELNKNN